MKMSWIRSSSFVAPLAKGRFLGLFLRAQQIADDRKPPEIDPFSSAHPGPLPGVPGRGRNARGDFVRAGARIVGTAAVLVSRKSRNMI
jgi:hypothetical protein